MPPTAFLPLAKAGANPELPPSLGSLWHYWGTTPSFPGSPARGLQGPWAARSPPPPGAVPVPAAGNSSAWLAPRPGIPVARDPRVPLSAAYPGLRNARRTAPSPIAETGCDRPRVAPCPVGSVPPALRAGGSGMSWSKAREGTRADPLTPPQERAGDRPPPPPLSSRPSLPQRGAEITPSPRGSDLGTWAGFRARSPALGPSTAFPPGS